MGMNRTVQEKKDGKGPTDRFARLSHKILAAPAFRALSPNARALLVELAMMDNGKNNGVGLFLSVRDAADRMGVSDIKAARAAFAELEDMGFIEMTAQAHFAVKCGAGSRARFWRLTWQAMNGMKGPTHEYEERQPAPKTRAHKRMDKGLRALARWRKEQGEGKIAVVDSSTHTLNRVADSSTTTLRQPPLRQRSVVDSSTQKRESRGIPPNVVVGDSSSYTAIPASTGEAGGLVGQSTTPVDDPLHGMIAAHWKLVNSAARQAMARAANITPHELKDFVEGRLLLPVGKKMALRAALKAAA
jgi:hypothetical protein